MKKTIIILITCLFCTLEGISQTIYRCNNDPSVTLSPNMFRTLQAAHDAASAGDIIYVEPSYNSTSYGGLTCTKTLRIIGNGFNHNDGTSIVEPWQKIASITNDIYINRTATGTVLEGLKINLVTSPFYSLIVRAQNVTIKNCTIATGSSIELYRASNGDNASGFSFIKNYGSGISLYAYGYSTYDNPSCSYTAYQVENVTIKNNILNNINFNHSTISSGGSCIAPPVQVSAAKNFNISQNTSDYISFPGGHCQNCTIASNIIKNGITPIPVSGGSVASNNVCTVNCGMGSNNISNAIWINLFANSAPNTDEQFKLSPTSVAIGAGVGGIDAGAYGTNDPYRISGLAPIPQITSYSKNASSGVYTTSTPLTVTISVRGNN